MTLQETLMSPLNDASQHGGVTPPGTGRAVATDMSGHSLTQLRALLEHARRRGVRLWSEDGQVRYRGPKGALSAQEIATLSRAKPLVAALLESGTVDETGHSDTVERAPLAYSQLAHWNLYRLHERPAIRQLAAAIRLRGRLRLDVMSTALQELVRRHAALRTRVVARNGIPLQEIGSYAPCEIETRDLTGIPDDRRDREVVELIEQFILRPIDVSQNALFGVQWVQLAAEDQVLIVAMEHMISDALSLNIFVHELFTAYTQSLQGRAISLPTVSVQFHEYARSQHQSHAAWLEEHDAYWTRRLAGTGRVRFPQDRPARHPKHVGWAEVPVHLGPELKKNLQSACQTRRTTLVMGVLTAYVASVMRWCHVTDLVVPYVIDGRPNAKLQNSIGYFASTLYLRASVVESDRLEDLLGRLVDEYCSAYEHADASFLTAREPRPEFSRNSAFNWVPEGPTGYLSGLAALGDAVSGSLVLFEHPLIRQLEIDSEPSVLLYDRGVEVVGSVCYPVNRFSRAQMRRFVTNFLSVLETLACRPDTRIRDLLVCTNSVAAVNA